MAIETLLDADRADEAVVAERTYVLLMTGHWDEALVPGRELTRDQIDTGALMLGTLQSVVEINVNRANRGTRSKEPTSCCNPVVPNFAKSRSRVTAA